MKKYSICRVGDNRAAEFKVSKAQLCTKYQMNPPGLEGDFIIF